jgi:UDP-N-acetylglucosamine/UDP-N-acetylgalactosamine diphosphorylase
LFAKTLSEIQSDSDRYTEIGIKAIKEGKVGAVLLAGGQGSRLGFDHPKGMFNIGVERELYIFECLINNLLDVTRMAGAYIPLFIMTSAENNKETREFFEKHNYFGYSSENVWFFIQEQLPTVDTNGKLMLADNGKILTAPNGNGGWYASMAKTGMLKAVQDAKIEWLNVFAVDNVLQRIADPCFIGAVIDSGKVSGAKVVAKAAPEEKVGVLCLEDGKPSIVEYYEMTDEMLNSREADGTLSYNYGVILNYLFRVDRLNKTLSVKLPLHRAFKKIKYMDESGRMVVPEEPNAYKFETLVLDMVKLQDDCLAYEVDRSREFAPVKNKSGVDSVDTARELLRLNGVEL